MTDWGTMERSDVCNSWCYCYLKSNRSEQPVSTISNHIFCPLGPNEEEKELRYPPFKLERKLTQSHHRVENWVVPRVVQDVPGLKTEDWQVEKIAVVGKVETLWASSHLGNLSRGWIWEGVLLILDQPEPQLKYIYANITSLGYLGWRQGACSLASLRTFEGPFPVLSRIRRLCCF